MLELFNYNNWKTNWIAGSIKFMRKIFAKTLLQTWILGPSTNSPSDLDNVQEIKFMLYLLIEFRTVNILVKRDE